MHHPVTREPAPSSSAVSLSALFPHPARLHTSISLSLAETEEVRIAIYGLLGRRVTVVHEGVLTEGVSHELPVNLTGVPAGVYVVHVEAERAHAARLLTVIR